MSEEQEEEIRRLRLCLHEICKIGAQGIADCENEGADHYAHSRKQTLWYSALNKCANKARKVLGLSIESGE